MNDFDHFYDFDDPDAGGVLNRLAAFARRAVKVGVGAGAALCVVVFGVRILDRGAADGRVADPGDQERRRNPPGGNVDPAPLAVHPVDERRPRFRRVVVEEERVAVLPQRVVRQPGARLVLRSRRAETKCGRHDISVPGRPT